MPLATFTKLNSIATVTDRRYSSEVIIRAPVIITMHGAPIIDGAVRISGDRIVQVGKTSQVTARSDRTKMIDLNGHVLLPGLVNPHCHLDYTGLRGKIPTQKSFTDWIRAINAEKAKLSEADYIESIAEGGREALRSVQRRW